jgi:uncharacterized membrane protein YuzA (DUF378 family)
MVRTNSVDWLLLTLLAIGGLNWGLIGLFDFNVVAALFGADSLLTNAIYIIVGASAVYVIASFLMKNEGRAAHR